MNKELPIKWGKVKSYFTTADGEVIDVESPRFKQLMKERAEKNK